MHNSGVDIYAADYDRRTALHLAAAEGNANVVSFLIDTAPPEVRQRILAARDLSSLPHSSPTELT